jgi:uracil-DNA glycosylase family 4
MAASTEQLRAYVEYLRDMGVHDLYRIGEPVEAELPSGIVSRAVASIPAPIVPYPALSPAIAAPRIAPAVERPQPPLPNPVAPIAAPREPFLPESSMPRPVSFNDLAPLPQLRVAAADRPSALIALRDEIGDCTRCPLAYAGRRKIVFANGDPSARLMFVGEGPGADEDASGEPFVGKAGQLLNNMINAMGLQREQVYVANIVKCRPPANRVPEPLEANTCSQFLVQQIDIVQPEIIVALGATAAMYLLGVKQSLASLRGSWHSCRGAKVAVTYHPAFLLRDPRQKGEAWKDLQRVMEEMGLVAPKRPA